MTLAADLQDCSLSLLEQLVNLREQGVHMEQTLAEELHRVSQPFAASARNFLHYLAIRQHDIRAMQHELAAMGLSSLGVLESHVMASLNAVIARLEDVRGEEESVKPVPPVDFYSGPALLQQHADALLGAADDGREVRIMVTLPSEAAQDRALIAALIRSGMEVARINCAHDDATAWKSMARHVREEAALQGKICRVQIDLAGPKSRTGALRALGRMLKIKPERDFRGKVLREGLLWVTSAAQPMSFAASDLQHAEVSGGVACLHFTGEGLETLQEGARLELHDARGRLREARVLCANEHGCLLAFDSVTLIEDGAELSSAGKHKKPRLQGALSGAPEVQEELRLCMGDELVLTRADLPGHAALADAEGHVLQPASLHCTLEAAFDDAKPGQAVWLDDGRIGAVIERMDAQIMNLRITHALPEGSRLKAEKGINFPDTDFHVSALTAKDIQDLEAMHAHCDLLAFSFVRSPADVELLQQHLARLHAEHLGIVLKIENRQAFENLPRLLLAGMRSPQLGVMVARGDLAVELGFERLSEVQEEIIWLCEAAHVPVIWATQILEGMAKSGAPSRPEVTDAAMSIRAECVMLNKGPHIVSALDFLIRVLARMEGHYSKRMATLRRLSIAGAVAGSEKHDA
ncbi:MAG: pyruvate kinase [Pseudomonadota bacterium]